MEQSKYLESFKRAEGTFKLYGSKILVERLELGEATTKGGLIIAEAPNTRQDLKLQKPHIATVLAVGEGYYDAETKSYLPLEVKPGNVVILNSLGVQYYSVVPGATGYTGNKIGMTTEDVVQMVFENIEQFQAYEKALNEEA